MQTKTLYDNALTFYHESNVINATKDGDNYWLELDATIFYPGGGGMLMDKGTIDGHEVLDLKKLDDGTILHLVDTELKGKVKLHLDEEYRLRRIQCHSSQHLVSALFIDEYKIDTVSAHYISDGTVDIIIDTLEVTSEQMKHVEKMANDIITQDLPYEISYLTEEEAKKYTNDIEEYEGKHGFRLVVIPNIDYNLCGCPHVPSSKYLKGIIITAAHRIKNQTKIDIMCGDLLIENAHKYYDELTETSNLLTSKLENVPAAVNTLSETISSLNNKMSNYKTKYLDLYSNDKLKSIDTSKINVVLESHDDLEMKDLQFLVSKFSGVKNIIIIGILKKPDGTSNLMIAKNKDITNFSARDVFKAISTTYGYRGGGNDVIAQGGGKIFENMDSIIEDLVKQNIK